MTRLNPSDSYHLTIPDDAEIRFGVGVTSVFRPGEEVVLQLSSVRRDESASRHWASAEERLQQHLAKDDFVAQSELIRHLNINGPEIAARTVTYRDGWSIIIVYLCWSRIALLLTITAPTEHCDAIPHWIWDSIVSIELSTP